MVHCPREQTSSTLQMVRHWLGITIISWHIGLNTFPEHRVSDIRCCHFSVSSKSHHWGVEQPPCQSQKPQEPSSRSPVERPLQQMKSLQRSSPVNHHWCTVRGLVRSAREAVTFTPHVWHSCSSPSGILRQCLRSLRMLWLWEIGKAATTTKASHCYSRVDPCLSDCQLSSLTHGWHHSQESVWFPSFTRHARDDVLCKVGAGQVPGAEPRSRHGVPGPEKGLWLHRDAGPMVDPWY